MISVLILTKNEEANLTRCLSSLTWCDDVVVFDSFSTDATVEIANQHGARVIQRKFDNFGAQREAARQVSYRHPWVLAVDADECADEQLVAELKLIANDDPSRHPVAFRLRRKDYFMGRWIRHCTLYPSWFIRFYRPDQIVYRPRLVHEYPDVDGEIGELEGHLIHDSFGKGLADWFGKHVSYAELESRENLRYKGDATFSQTLLMLKDFRDPVSRRRALKALSFFMPMRPTLRFLYSYVLRGGFLDGRPGFRYCQMLAAYETMIVTFNDYASHRDCVSKQEAETLAKGEAISQVERGES